MKGWLAALLLGLALYASADAGPPSHQLYDYYKGNRCPATLYSPWHYWMPEVFRVRQILHPPAVPLHAGEYGLPVPPDYRIIKYPCPSTMSGPRPGLPGYPCSP